jgi:cytochrome c oxidase subunit 4
MSTQVTPKKVYFAVFFALMVFTAITVAAATFDFGSLNTPIALVIAAAKATLVIWFFMEVRHTPPLTKVAVASGIFGFALLLVFTLSDYMSRNWLPLPQPW